MKELVKIEFSTEKFIKKGDDVVAEVLPKSFKLFFDSSQKNYQTIRGLLNLGYLYESDVSGFMARVVNEGDLVIDVGANIGFYSILLSSLVGNSGGGYSL